MKEVSQITKTQLYRLILDGLNIWLVFISDWSLHLTGLYIWLVFISVGLICKTLPGNITYQNLYFSSLSWGTVKNTEEKTHYRCKKTTGSAFNPLIKKSRNFIPCDYIPVGVWDKFKWFS